LRKNFISRLEKKLFGGKESPLPRGPHNDGFFLSWKGRSMRNAIIVFMLFLLTSIGFGCSGRKTDDAGGFLAKSDAAASRKLPDFVTLAKKLQPVVVNVSTTQIAPGLPPGARPDQEEDPMNEFLERFFGQRSPSGRSQQRSLGSGFIIGSDGSIVTNAHVVEKAKKIIVKLPDKREFEAKLLGKDLKTDVALIKIDSKESLPTAELGNSEQLQVGEWVMAIGNPFGLDSSVTSGIVSAKGRHIGAGPYDNFIQTDTPINPGSSGGPLVNLRGQVVGINMAIISQTGGNMGIGFATPINLVKELLPQLEAKGKVTRGWMGIAIQEVTPDLANAFGLQKPQGALVAQVVTGGPAERGGIKVGDIITEYDGQQVKEANDFPLMVARTQVNREVQLKVLREGKNVPFRVTVAEMPEAPEEKIG
jgi:serine protease Do